jgi:penicillin V acylase-like amidase (Ntn superfamily)
MMEAAVRKRNVIVLLFAFSLFLTASKSHSCTSFCLGDKERPVVGKNYDWSVGDGLVIVNKRGVHKTAAQYRDEKFGKPIRWTSKFGSVTFNQFGRELPMGGMNESGLVVELLMLTETVYPDPDSRPSISMLQWVQYQLDNFSTTQEVIESNSQLRILPPLEGPGMHYFVCDRDGNCASIEFLDGEFVDHTGGTMPVKVLTNSTYEDSLGSWIHEKQSGAPSYQTTGRFVLAANLLKDYHTKKSEEPVNNAFSVLEKVSQGSFTKWSIVYDIPNLTVHFRTFSNQRIRHIALRDFDFSCGSPVLVLDTNGDFQGDVTGKFLEYTRTTNRMLLENALRNISFQGLDRKEILDKMTRYPEDNICMH